VSDDLKERLRDALERMRLHKERLGEDFPVGAQHRSGYQAELREIVHLAPQTLARIEALEAERDAASARASRYLVLAQRREPITDDDVRWAEGMARNLGLADAEALEAEVAISQSNAGAWEATAQHEYARALRAEAQLAKMREQRDDAAQALHEIKRWAEAYPVDVFVPLTPEQIKAAVEAIATTGVTSDALHASWARHIARGIGDIARRGLAALADAEEQKP